MKQHKIYEDFTGTHECTVWNFHKIIMMRLMNIDNDRVNIWEINYGNKFKEFLKRYYGTL